ncbi:hypothetical protein NPIL_464731 [Nephila pilipes]|uniref:Uncharacterized protein n=1 Tax=Nephila pilipes TaxID=299642 RepID=A0A8X6TZX9_NEPPI|nr:hypothetical protein NPIL_464731 [Nephila pilipes]
MERLLIKKRSSYISCTTFLQASEKCFPWADEVIEIVEGQKCIAFKTEFSVVEISDLLMLLHLSSSDGESYCKSGGANEGY